MFYIYRSAIPFLDVILEKYQSRFVLVDDLYFSVI